MYVAGAIAICSNISILPGNVRLSQLRKVSQVKSSTWTIDTDIIIIQEVITATTSLETLTN